jgi:hypothetical protein
MSGMSWIDADDPWLTGKLRTHAQLVRAEDAILSAMADAMAEFLAHARRSLLDDGHRRPVTAAGSAVSQGAPPNLDLWPQMQVWAQLLQGAVLARIGDLWDRAFTAAAFGAADPSEGMRGAFLALVLARLMDGFPRRALAEVRWELDTGMAARESVARLRERVARVLDVDAASRELRAEMADAGGEELTRLQRLAAEARRLGQGIWQQWARRAARTETGAGWNAGTFAGGQASGRLLAKVWWSRGDDRVRDTHRRAHGQVQPYGAPFAIGESALMYPGDPNGPVDEVVNCRCVLQLREVGNSGDRDQFADYSA